jgi:hypothetical protein
MMPLNRKKILVVLVFLIAVIQLIPINRSNPAATAEVAGAQDFMVLKRSCLDCHSNETTWPWYSRIAPVSWMLAYDVYEGREHLNFSHWGDYPGEKQVKLRKEIREEVDEGEMPPFQYYLVHREARLGNQDKEIIRRWAAGGETLSQ